jgi:hypothetical protein
MHFVSGRLSKFNRDPDGKVNGMLLDTGQEIRLPPSVGHLVSPIVCVGNLVGIQGQRRSDDCPEGSLHATLIMNLDSRQSVTLPTPEQVGKPGMQLTAPPSETASLAHPNSKTQRKGNLDDSPAAFNRDMLEISLAEADSKPLNSATFFHSLLRENEGKTKQVARNAAACSIGLAYDSLHRTQAILAYLHIIKHRVPGISQFLDEAKHTYEQALSRFSASDFFGAKEFAEASGGLSRVVEIVIARTLRSDSTLPSLVPPPPDNLGVSPAPENVEEDLAHAEAILSKIHWLLENGTLPSEERAQVRKIASWGDALYKEAKRTYKDAVFEDASEFAQAALAGASSAEHVCRKWYVSHPVHS